MRTNIVLDEDLIREARQYSSASTKRGLVEEALRTFVAVKSSERRRETYARRLAEIRQKTSALRLGKAPSEILREDRLRR